MRDENRLKCLYVYRGRGRGVDASNNYDAHIDRSDAWSRVKRVKYDLLYMFH